MPAITQRRIAGVCTLTLDRPEVHNAFDDALIAELTACLLELDRDPEVRAVVLTGAGKSFSAGADLGWMRRMAEAGEEENREDARRLARLMRVLDGLSHPTIARVNGAAFGGGVGLIACCDIAVAVQSARFGLTETRLGLVPAVISPYVIEAIGARQARRWFLSAETFDAATAQRIGLIHELAADDALDACVEAILARLAETAPGAVREAKRLVRRIARPEPLRQRGLDEANADLIAALRVGEEGQEGLRAFLDKRRPRWTGA
ncbi:MAG: enoyl-CoA hydratase [Lysobacteraceae bacterium]|nr:MAG: enoyl-CoA hydratase [Xanthomonadaceae bacterium]